MSPAFIKGVAEHLPNAKVTFDKFHIVKIVNDAAGEVRRVERKTHTELKGTRYIWLRNPDTLSQRQRAMLEALPTRTLKTARAYQIRLAFQDMYTDRRQHGNRHRLSEEMVFPGYPQPLAADD